MKFIVEENKSKSIRFVAVGIANTLIDFGIYTLLILIGLPSVIANYPATTSAMVFSFFANKKYTFNDDRKDVTKQILQFLLVTLVGLWVLQPLIILFVEDTLQKLIMNQTLGSIFAKLVATVASLTWNYILYSRYVFKSNDSLH